MKKFFVLIFIVLVGLLFISASVPGEGEEMRDIRELDLGINTQDIRFKGAVKPDLNFGKFPLYFIANKGQVNKKAKFYAKASRYTLWLTGEGLVFDRVKKVKVEAEVEEKAAPFGQIINVFGKDTNKKVPGKFLSPDIHASMQSCNHASMQYHSQSPYSPHSPYSPKIQRDVSRLVFLNANKNPGIVSIEESKLKVNYFIGNDPSKWYCDVPTSKAVLYKELYKNIDLKVYGIEKQIEYDWIVKPGGNPGDIRFEYKNVKGTRIDNQGNLMIETDFGELVHKKLVSYQEFGAVQGVEHRVKKYVNVAFKKIGKNTYGFEIGEYDKSYELIIDPVVLAYSTYLGGRDTDCGSGIAVDSSGNAYVTGRTWSTDFPCKNQYQTDPLDNHNDAFVTKIDTNQTSGPSLIYSTYLGGGSWDDSYGIAVDSSGNAYVTGYTSSTDFPCKNEFQTDQGDSTGDVFVTKIDTTQSGASSLIYSTYLGGGSWDRGYGIAVDSSGNAYVTGETFSTDFPCLNQYQTNQGGNDAFVTKIDTTQSGASSLIYSTFLGGGDWDDAYGIAVDSSGNAYVTGRTDSTDFPCKNQYMADPGDSIWDVFVTKIDTTQTGVSSLIYSTYLGGGGLDEGYGIAVDSSGNAYVTGETLSTDFPCLNQYQTDQGSTDAFVTKIDTTQSGASSLIYSTYLGGGSWDRGYGIAVDSRGSAYVTGETYSTNFPCLNQYQGAHAGGYVDAFVTKMAYVVLPTVKTKAVSGVTPTTASSGGRVSADGGAAVTARGVCWRTSANPTIANSHTKNGTGTGTFTSSITGLNPVTTYHVRAYATNSVGTSYGNDVTFTTPPANVTISGTVTDGTNPVEDVTITFSHDGHTETTDSDGNYSYTVEYGTSTTVTASKPGYTFTPSEYSFTNLTEDKPNKDFTTGNYVSVTITNPQNEDTVSGAVFITAEVSSTETDSASSLSNQLAEKVEFYIDGVLVKQDKRTPYKHLWNTTQVPDGSHTIKAKAYHSSGLTHQHQITVKVYNSTGPSHIQLNREWLNFGAVIGDSRTGSQRFLISNSGGGTLDWTASVSAAWIQVSPLSGTADMIVKVSIDAAGLTPGSYTGTITITDPNADNSPAVLYIYLEVKEKPQEVSPFGSFDSPVDGAFVSGSVPITGWALDDVDVSKVKIFRNPLEGHETGLIYIGDAVFVEDARPDVEGKFPTYPRHYRAGWGYMMLSNVLPNEGNGTFVITSVALDSSGNEVKLGEKTIICDNANAVKPFGAIDTPTQGGDAAGAEFINFGWALTPKPKTIKKNGSTIKVWVDGVPLEGNPEYNQYRKDVAALFSGYNNGDGAGGYYYLDTTLYANGVHTIAWSATDDAGNTDGIGSRYFNVMNVKNPTPTSASGFNYGFRHQDRFSIDHLPAAASPVYLKKGYKASSHQNLYYPGSDGIITIEIKEGERIQIQSTSTGYYCGYMVVGDQLKPLPVGSFLDTGRGIFYWQPGVGFIGKYGLVFIEKSQNGEFKRKHINVIIHPKY